MRIEKAAPDFQRVPYGVLVVPQARRVPLGGSNIATGRQRSVQFILREALVRDDEGRILNAFSTIAVRKAGTPAMKQDGEM